MDYPFAFNSGIVKKALGKGFDDFVEKYHGTRAAAKKFKVGTPVVNFATYKVGRYYWFNH